MWENLKKNFNQFLYPTDEHKEILPYLDTFLREYTIRNLNQIFRINMVSMLAASIALMFPIFDGLLKWSLVVFVVFTAFYTVIIYYFQRIEYKVSYKWQYIVQMLVILTFLYGTSAFNAFKYNDMVNIHLYIIVFAYTTILLHIPALTMAVIGFLSLSLNIISILVFHTDNLGTILYEIFNLIFFISFAWYFGVVGNRHRMLLWLNVQKHKQENELLQDIALKDSMTQFFNHDHIFRLLDLSIKESHLKGSSLALLIIDIDNFKNINDQYGHLKGDEVLLAVSECIRSNVRDQDILGRHGGEEFMIIFPNANHNQALTVSERIRETVEQLRLGEIRLTISGGLACLDQHSRDELIELADSRLYKAKMSGKNRIISKLSS